jgi:mannitol-1-phosphate 5-dehydrogenase
LNIIICENLIDADKYLRKLIENEMGIEYKEVLDKNLGLVEASIGRMVPIMTDEMREGNILRVWVEPYSKLPVDSNAFIGKIPKLNGLVPFTPFGFYIKRKLYIHNMGHAISAYLGWQKGYKYIYQSIEDNEIRSLVESAMKESANALSNQYGIPIEEIYSNVNDLLRRFGNKALGDTVARVGYDPIRKLGMNDRLVGAAKYCIEQRIEPTNIIIGIISGLKYNNDNDNAANDLQDLIKDKGLNECLIKICGLFQDTNLYNSIADRYSDY